MSTVEIRELELPAPATFAGMTFPAYRHLLAIEKGTRHLEPNERIIRPLTIAAWQGTTPVGLGLAELPTAPDGTAPQLLSVYVLPELRNQGIGTAIVSALERDIRSKGFDYVEAVYTVPRGGTDAIERIFSKQGWSAPVVRAITVRFLPAVIASKPWFDEVRRSAPDCEIFPWDQLRVEERDEIRRTNTEARWIPAGREPWSHDLEGFDRISSVGLRRGGAVLGWIINHQVAEDTTRFSCAFVRDDLMAEGKLLPLLADSIGRLAEAGITIGTCVTPLSESQIAMLVNERCPDAVEFLGESRGSTKWLNEDTAVLGA